MYTRQDSRSSSCFYLLSAEIKGVCHHTWPSLAFLFALRWSQLHVVSCPEGLIGPGTEGELWSPESTRNSVSNNYVCEWAGGAGFYKEVLRDSFLTPAISGTSSLLLAGSKLSSPMPWNSTPILLLQMFHICLLTSKGYKEKRCCYSII